MKIGFIGAGRVGVSLGKYFKLHGEEVVGFYSRSLKSADEAADFTGTESFDKAENLLLSIDVLFLTVPDREIEPVWESLKKFHNHIKIVCHCSGALSSAVFQNKGHKPYGCSIHPMFAFSDKYTSYENLPEAYFTLEGEEPGLQEIKKLLIKPGNPFKTITKEKKSKYHCAGVFASNLVTSLFAVARDILGDVGFAPEEAEKALTPLLFNNVLDLKNKGTEESLTGPLERNDISTVIKHLNSLEGREKDVYTLLSQKLIDVAQNKNKTCDYGDMKGILDNEQNEKYS